MASDIKDVVSNHDDNNNNDNGSNNVNNNNGVPLIDPIIGEHQNNHTTWIQKLQKKSSRASAIDEARPVRKKDMCREEGWADENGNGSGTNESSRVLKMLQALTKRMVTNEKKVETYNSLVDQILGAPPIMKGPHSKRCIQLLFQPSTALKLIPKRFKISDLPKYDGTKDPYEYVTSYTCAVNGNDMHPDEIESVLLKKFGETLSKGAMTCYSMLHEHSINSFEMLADAFIKAYIGARKVQARKANIFKIAQKDTELLREFVTRF
ncbi:hypothetical protein K7X08_002163 [Anisodus acutangulus]|uniref:Retrotransposon gag domain-containing protein n=1 Tax=Anisodus acutangulus TaxID=402998 RepID=A0A9Q1LSF9_9SOLA|nr:hypothetical protein K7X08_002163 [Anisodus acutangulus]